MSLQYYIDVSDLILSECEVRKQVYPEVPSSSLDQLSQQDSFYELDSENFVSGDAYLPTPFLTLSQFGEQALHQFGWSQNSENLYSYESYEGSEQQAHLVINSDQISDPQALGQNEKFQSRTSISQSPNKSCAIDQQTSKDEKKDRDHIMLKGNLQTWWLESRRNKIDRYLKKKQRRNWNNKFSYSCRKNVANVRLRVKGKFITKQQAEKILNEDLKNVETEQIKTKLKRFQQK